MMGFVGRVSRRSALLKAIDEWQTISFSSSFLSLQLRLLMIMM